MSQADETRVLHVYPEFLNIDISSIRCFNEKLFTLSLIWEAIIRVNRDKNAYEMAKDG